MVFILVAKFVPCLMILVVSPAKKSSTHVFAFKKTRIAFSTLTKVYVIQTPAANMTMIRSCVVISILF